MFRGRYWVGILARVLGSAWLGDVCDAMVGTNGDCIGISLDEIVV